MNKLLIITISTLLLTACSPAELFSQFATSDVEQAASEAVKRQNAQQQKLELIEAKKSAFPVSVLLTPSEEESVYQAIAFRNVHQIDERSILDIEAILADSEELEYIVWLKTPQSKTYQKLGVLSLRDVDDYFFTYETTEDITSLTQIFISLDDDTVTIPKNIILSGEFSIQ